MPEQMPFEDYARQPGINASAIQAGAVSMKHMHAVMTGKPKPATPAMRMGSLIHAASLEPARFAERVSIYDGRKYGKAWDAHCEEHDADWVVTRAQYADLFGIQASVHSNPHAHRLIEGTEHEVSLSWTDSNYGQCKARLDGFSEQRGVLELKTTAVISPERFARTAYSIGYHRQLGWYWHAALEAVGGKLVPVHVVTVEQSAPYDCVVYQVPENVLESGYEEADRIAREYHVHRMLDRFPGVSDEVLEYALPAWVAAAEPVELEIGGETTEV